VVATNLILWLRTLIRESLEEISEVEEEHEKDIELHLNETEVVSYLFVKFKSFSSSVFINRMYP
jgi:hypothetical protein